jgi:hypothetical protein
MTSGTPHPADADADADASPVDRVGCARRVSVGGGVSCLARVRSVCVCVCACVRTRARRRSCLRRALLTCA